MWRLYVKRIIIHNIVVIVVHCSSVHREDVHDGHLRDAIKDLRRYCHWQWAFLGIPRAYHSPFQCFSFLIMPECIYPRSI